MVSPNPHAAPRNMLHRAAWLPSGGHGVPHNDTSQSLNAWQGTCSKAHPHPPKFPKPERVLGFGIIGFTVRV